MENFQGRLGLLQCQIRDFFERKADIDGVESKFTSEKVIRIPDEVQFNLDGGRYAVEINGNKIIDNEGYHYNIWSLTVEQMAEIADKILELD
jgi:hypothetical protein